MRIKKPNPIMIDEIFRYLCCLYCKKKKEKKKKINLYEKKN